MSNLLLDNACNEKTVNSPFQHQNTLFKILVVILGLYITLFFRWQYFLAVFLVTLLWLTPNIKIIGEYLKTLIRIAPFITSYIILGIIFSISFNEQIVFVSRISLLLLFSVFLLKTTTIENILSDTCHLRKWKVVNSFVFYCLATLLFADLFFSEIKSAGRKIRKIENVINVFTESFNHVYRQTEAIEKKVAFMTSQDYQSLNAETNPRQRAGKDFINSANVYLTFLLTLYIIIIAL